MISPRGACVSLSMNRQEGYPTTDTNRFRTRFVSPTVTPLSPQGQKAEVADIHTPSFTLYDGQVRPQQVDKVANFHRAGLGRVPPGISQVSRQCFAIP